MQATVRRVAGLKIEGAARGMRIQDTTEHISKRIGI